MNNFKQLCNELKIPASFISSPIYGEYFFSITIPFDFDHWRMLNVAQWMYPPNTEEIAKRKERRTRFQENKDTLLKTVTDRLGYSPIHRFSDQSLGLYFVNEAEAVDAIKRVIKNDLTTVRIKSVRMPKNEQHHNAMLGNPTTIVKSALWFGRYAYKVKLGFIPYGQRQFVNETLDGIFEGYYVDHYANYRNLSTGQVIRRQVLNIKNERCRYTGTNVLYFGNFDDLTMTKLALGKYFVSYEECVVL